MDTKQNRATTPDEVVESEHDVLVDKIVQMLVDYEQTYVNWEHIKKDVDSVLKYRVIR